MIYIRRITVMIEIKNITKKYGDFTAIEDISFNVENSVGYI